MRYLSLMLVLATVGFAPAAMAERIAPESRTELQLSYAPVVKQTAPAVVNIYATWVVERRASPFADDPFFSQFFDGFGQSMPRVQNSLGSGVIVDSDGIVVSNHHVVQEATEIRVVLSDRREFDGTVLMSDPETDIAVIRLDGAENLPAVDFADSEGVEVGDLVLAIGNPFGVGQTVSSGIVSATARTGNVTGQGAAYYLQTDAPINPGNSGGALVDMSGRLLGLNTAILSRSGGSNGIGFAIPSNLVAQYVAQAKQGRDSFARPWSGIAVQRVDGGLADALGQSVPEGVLVSEIHGQSPFVAAGVQAGDVILSIDNLPVNGAAELDFRLMTAGTGAVVTVAVLRGGEQIEIPVTIGVAPGEADMAPARIEGYSPLAGLLVADVTPRLIDELDLPLSTRGVIVVGADGPARRLGLRGGDMVRRLNGREIGKVRDLQDAVQAGGRSWDMEVTRGDRQMRLRIRG